MRRTPPDGNAVIISLLEVMHMQHVTCRIDPTPKTPVAALRTSAEIE